MLLVMLTVPFWIYYNLSLQFSIHKENKIEYCFFALWKFLCSNSHNLLQHLQTLPRHRLIDQVSRDQSAGSKDGFLGGEPNLVGRFQKHFFQTVEGMVITSTRARLQVFLCFLDWIRCAYSTMDFCPWSTLNIFYNSEYLIEEHTLP